MADETEHGEPWGGSLEGLLKDMAQEATLMLAEARPDPKDVAAIERRLRAIGVATRTLRVLRGLSPAETRGRQLTEDTMGGQCDDGLEAEDTEVLRARLQARIDDMRAAVEWKRNGRPGEGPARRGPEVVQVAA